jgi:ABC-type sugar transport system substrate-binding protein
MSLGRLAITIGLTLALAVAIAASALSGPQRSTAAIKIGYSSDALSQPAQAEAHDGAVAEAKALGVQLYEAHAPDAAGQASGIEDLFTKGINVLAVDPNDGKAIGTLVKEANAKNIPVIMFVGADEGGGTTKSLITTDEKQGGYDISVAMFKKLGGKGQVAFIQGCICHPAGKAREDGFRQALKKYPGIKLVAYGSTNWDPVKANQLATDMLSKNPNINAFIALTDPMANAAYRAVLATNGQNHAIVSGYNGVCSALNLIWKGQQAATLDQNWRGIGKQVVDTAVAIAKGQKVSPKIILPSYVIDKQAMQEVLKGTFPGQTPSLLASVKAAIAGCKGTS